MKINELKIKSQLIRALEEEKIVNLTEIQTLCIPKILNKENIVAKSPTGSGKTFAYAIPLVETMKDEKSKKPKILILAPTRELAIQIMQEFRKLTKYVEGIKITSIYGGVNINSQITNLKKSPQIIIGTPGRIIDHIKRKTIKLNEIESVVLDEADEMLNIGFFNDIMEILSLTPKNAEKLMFSATMPESIKTIIQTHFEAPEYIEVKDANKPKINEYFIQGDKQKNLINFLDTNKDNTSIVFTNTKKMSNELMKILKKNNVDCVCLHGDLDQKERLEALKRFKNKKVNVLITTDVLARGIDISNVDFIVNYDLPLNNQTYTHRIGRTARAGKTGSAINLIKTEKEKTRLSEISTNQNSQFFLASNKKENKIEDKDIYKKKKITKNKMDNKKKSNSNSKFKKAYSNLEDFLNAELDDFSKKKSKPRRNMNRNSNNKNRNTRNKTNKRK